MGLNENRYQLKWLFGFWLAGIAHAFVMILTENLFDHPVRLIVGAVLVSLLSVGCILVWRRDSTGPVGQSFCVTFGAVSLFFVLLALSRIGVSAQG
jgi:hypothetical protein